MLSLQVVKDLLENKLKYKMYLIYITITFEVWLAIYI